MLLQYFITYQLKKGWYITSSPIITANWKAAKGSVWTTAAGGGFGRVMKLGFQPVNLSSQFFGNAEYPKGGSPWGARAQISFLFPRLSKEEEEMILEKKLKQLQQDQHARSKEAQVSFLLPTWAAGAGSSSAVC